MQTGGQERKTGKDLSNDGNITLLPGVNIPEDWGQADKFITVFYDRLNYLSSGYGLDMYLDHRDESIATTDIAQALLDACHDTGCPGKKALFFSWASSVVVDGVAEGGSFKAGRESARNSGKKSKSKKPSGCNCFSPAPTSSWPTAPPRTSRTVGRRSGPHHGPGDRRDSIPQGHPPYSCRQ
ncbi:hypothetical protein [Streptomyces sp. KL116D]|uniref:hypothetical protein n=1 Tax=Streptomyces sp. KL116D TaxID=3045152 RepID=UPI0035564E01